VGLYAPANVGVDVVFGSLEECVLSALAGRVIRDRPVGLPVTDVRVLVAGEAGGRS
jgi:hypothetical protein